jgi:molecular chaperone GrpE
VARAGHTAAEQQQQQHPEPREPDPGPATPPSEHDDPAAVIADLEDRWRRAAAEVENLRKRHLRELEQVRSAERARVASTLLPILDDLERALEHAGADPDTIVAGIRTVRDHAVEVLARLGYPRQDETGVPFDPRRHEVVRVVEDPDVAQGTVVEVVRPGYGEPGRQLRPEAVAVSKGAE